MQFSTFSCEELRNSPDVLTLTFQQRSYKAEYKAFCANGNQHKTPVIFLGGAFQSFSSFRSEVEQVLTTHPVVLLDLPSQGNNDQLAPELSLPDYAQLIEQFCQSQQLARVMVLGISYGSAMATLFATAFPQRVERLLLSGITCFRRQSLIALLEDSLQQLRHGDMNAFASTAVCNLINHSRLQQTEVSPTYRRLLFRQIARLNDNERARYAQNTQRLLNFPGFSAYPDCPTLIATGEYDNFTLPAENAAVARQCADATFAVIYNADHLAQFERKEAATALFHGFMCGLPIHQIAGTRLYDPQHFVHQEQRLQPRHRPLEQPYLLMDQASGKEHVVRIRNINFAGCELQLTSADLSLGENSAALFLELPETSHLYHVRILERSRKVLRCLIIQRDLKAADALLGYLNSHLLMVRDDPAVQAGTREQLA